MKRAVCPRKVRNGIWKGQPFSHTCINHACSPISWRVKKKWSTLRARVSGWIAETAVDINLVVDGEQRWRLNGIEQPAVTGCIDVDLNFSPSTNLLPIRRLNLTIGQQALVKAAWLKFPSFELQPLSQVYSRIEESTYRYESGDGQFTADLKVDRVGFVRDYPGIWQSAELVP